MDKYTEAMKHLEEKFGNNDIHVSLSTIALQQGINGMSKPAARIVDAYYEDGYLYTVTHALSNKMRQIAHHPEVAVCFLVETFTADGIAENLGWVCDDKNAEIIKKLREVFSAWYYEANNEEDKNTCILRVKLTHGLWFDAHTGKGSHIDFVNKTVK